MRHVAPFFSCVILVWICTHMQHQPCHRHGLDGACNRCLVVRPSEGAGPAYQRRAGCGACVWPRHHRGTPPRHRQYGEHGAGGLWCFTNSCPQTFLRENGLSLILRSHEGPDARAAAMEEAMSLELVEAGEDSAEAAAGAAAGDTAEAAAEGAEHSQQTATDGQPNANALPEAHAAIALKAAQTLLKELREAAAAQCMALMQEGFTEDHVTPSACRAFYQRCCLTHMHASSRAGGKLYTVFSAAAYPQFVAEGESRVDNRGAVAVLSPPTYDAPEFVTYEAVRPLPSAAPYYDVGEVPGSDEEFEAVGEGSVGGSLLESEVQGAGHEEVQQVSHEESVLKASVQAAADT